MEKKLLNLQSITYKSHIPLVPEFQPQIFSHVCFWGHHTCSTALIYHRVPARKHQRDTIQKDEDETMPGYGLEQPEGMGRVSFLPLCYFLMLNLLFQQSRVSLAKNGFTILVWIQIRSYTNIMTQLEKREHLPSIREM